MANELPYEIIAGPLEVYIAPVGETMPAVTAEPPAGNWVLLGTVGDTEYSEEGVHVRHTETVEDYKSLGSTAPVKSFRTEEGLMISFVLNDLTLEEYSRVLNLNTVALSSNDKTLSMYKGGPVATRALLVRGADMGPYGTAYNIQWEIPRVRPSGDQDIVFAKGAPAGLQVEFTALIDLDAASDAARFGLIRTQYQN